MPDEMESRNDAEVDAVKRGRDELRGFVDELTTDDISSGRWFETLLARSLRTYTTEVDWRYFQRKYQGLPPDAIVEQRIQMAARYASIEGGLSASAYTGATALTIGSLGGASPATVPAAMASMMVDVVYVSRLQLRLAYDISVLYRVPLDTSDPEDLWKLIRIAFTIKGGEVVREGLVKSVPALVRPFIKRFYRTDVLKAARGLPVVGKYLLQRNVIKIGIPLVGIPLAVILNRQTTLIAGRHARMAFRNEARIIEVAEDLSRQINHPTSALWVAWLVAAADDRISDDKALLLRHMVRLLRDDHGVVDEELERRVIVDEASVSARLAGEKGDLRDLIAVAEQVAAIDGPATRRELAVIAGIRERCAQPPTESA